MISSFHIFLNLRRFKMQWKTKEIKEKPKTWKLKFAFLPFELSKEITIWLEFYKIKELKSWIHDKETYWSHETSYEINFKEQLFIITKVSEQDKSIERIIVDNCNK